MTEDYIGACGYTLFVNTREDGRVAVSLKSQQVVVGDQSRDEMAFMVAATLFRHIFKEHLTARDLDASHFTVIAEVPEEFLRDEWREALETMDAFPFRLTSDPIADEVTKFVPKVQYNEADDQEE